MACDHRAEYPNLALRRQLGNMSLEADEALVGSWLCLKGLVLGASQLNSRSLPRQPLLEVRAAWLQGGRGLVSG